MTVVDGRTVVDKRWVTFPDDLYDTAVQEQPNGVDLRVENIYTVTGSAYVPANSRVITRELRAQELDPKDGTWSLNPFRDNCMYYVDFREHASIKPGICAMIITRSSLVRSGVDVQSGLWDTGWEGRLGGVLRVYNPIEIQYGARLAQLVVLKSDFNGKLYSGRYQGSTSQQAILT